MRLLRLTSRADNATFDAFFNSDIILKPNSKIALQSVSINNLNKIIQITSDNNDITYQINANITRTINLTPRVYQSSQLDQLLQDLTNKLNNSSEFSGVAGTNKILGIEWAAFQNSDNLVEIGYQLSKQSNFAEEWDFKGTAFTPPSSNNAIVSASSETSVSGFTQNCLLQYNMARGNGYFRTRTQILEGGNTKNGYIMGVFQDGDTTNANLDLKKIKYGIRVDIDGGGQRFYRTIIEGVEDTTQYNVVNYTSGVPADNETQEIALNGSQIELNIYRPGSSSIALQLATVPIVNNEDLDLKPVLAFFGTKSTTQASLVRFLPSPYEELPQPLTDTDEGATVNAPPRPANRITGDPNSLAFQSSRLSEFLGYENQRIPLFGTTSQPDANGFEYIADTEFAVPQEADAMLVQLLSLNLESYDSYADINEVGGQRSNLLAVIPQTNDSGKIVFSPPQIVFLDLNNAENINLRNISLRVVREDYEQIKTVGLNTIVLLIE